jgi:hypothetical protein
VQRGVPGEILLGEVDVRALIPGTVHPSAFAYLKACTRSRYLSIMRPASTGS